LSLALAPQQASAGAWLYENGQVSASSYDEDGQHHITVTLSIADKQRFARQWPDILLSDISRPDTPRPDTPRPDISQPDIPQPDISRPNILRPK